MIARSAIIQPNASEKIVPGRISGTWIDPLQTANPTVKDVIRPDAQAKNDIAFSNFFCFFEIVILLFYIYI